MAAPQAVTPLHQRRALAACVALFLCALLMGQHSLHTDAGGGSPGSPSAC